MNKILKLIAASALVVHFSACGMILYPERRGQRGTRIDVGVAIMDGIGLFFFLLPGVIAFAVDFTQGTIYYPPEHHKASLKLEDLERVRFDPRQGPAIMEHAASERMRVVKLKSSEEMLARLAALP